MSRTTPSLRPGTRRPFRAEVGQDAGGWIRVSLYAVAGFPRAVEPAWRWESKQAALAINAQIKGARAFVGRGDVETSLRWQDDAERVRRVCEHWGWIRPAKQA